jgi:hypothetical protein
MKKRIVDLRFGDKPLLDVVSYGKGAPVLTSAQRLHIALTVHRVPEVMVKVSGGARTLGGVGQHFSYIGREGDLGLEMDTGARIDGKGFEQTLISDWDLDIEALNSRSGHSIPRRKPVKLVHNIIFSMPPGTSPGRVLKAVKKLAANEWALKHRYAMVLHTDDKHPHVHVVVKAMSEQGTRLNIQKATLRSWRAQFAKNLRELGIAANATERAVRGQSRSHARDPIYRANQRGESTYIARKRAEVGRELAAGKLRGEAGRASLLKTREDVSAGWRRLGAILDADGDHKLADAVRSFESRTPRAWTEKEWTVRGILERSRGPKVNVKEPPTR